MTETETVKNVTVKEASGAPASGVTEVRIALKAKCSAENPITEPRKKAIVGRRVGARVVVMHEDQAYSEAHGCYFCLNCNDRIGTRRRA